VTGCGRMHGRAFMERSPVQPNVADELPHYVHTVAFVAAELACLCVFARRQVCNLVRFIPTFVFLLLVIGLVASASSLTILYTNDIHDRLGSLAGLSALIERERANDAPVLLFDSGDTWQDFLVPLYAVWGADEMVSWMNGVKYDAMAIGNHDLYYGADCLAGISSKLNFPVLCANLVPLPGYEAPYRAYTTIDVNGMRVLLIGVITAEYLPYLDFPWLEYVDPEQAIERVLSETKGRADFVIVLGHLPVTQAVQIARAVPDIGVYLLWSVYSGLDAYNVAKDTGFTLGMTGDGLTLAYNF